MRSLLPLRSTRIADEDTLDSCEVELLGLTELRGSDGRDPGIEGKD